MASSRARLAALRRQIAADPAGLVASHTISPPNRPLVLHRGHFTVKHNKDAVPLRGRVEFRWFPSVGIHFQGRASRKAPDFELGPLELVLPTLRAKGTGFLLSQTYRSKSATVDYAGVLSSALRIGRARAAKAVRFYVVNFHSYIGSRVRFGQLSTPTIAASRLELEGGDWCVRLDQQPRFEELLRALRTHGGLAVGHVGLAERRDGRPIPLEQASHFLESLHFFLGFLRGFWCGPVIPVGLGARGPLWTEWAPWRTTPWTGVSSWFPTHDTAQITQAFAVFQPLWRSPLWNQALRNAIHWYVEANTGAGALEGSTVFAQTALELLGWAQLVEQEARISADGFEKLPAADKIRLLLAEFRIPSAIPEEYSELRAASGPKSFPDGPGAIAFLRNAIIHGKQSKRAIVSQASTDEKHQILEIALSYIELVLLGVMKYRGKYVRRWTHGTFASATTDVPWA